MARLKNTSTLTLSPFEQQLKKILKWFKDPARIGKESPLASAYFLSGAAANPQNHQCDTATARGQQLCQEIRHAAATLWDGPLPETHTAMCAALHAVRADPQSPRYAYVVLELRCFQDFLRPKRTAEIWLNEAYLPGSQSEHYRDYDAAVIQLGRMLLERLHPSLRPEQPPLPINLVGYEAQLTEIAQALCAGKSVNLTGAGGVGKTAVAAHVVQQQTARPIFWYTIRATRNDHLPGLLFALGLFLHKGGSEQLWQLILASGGTLDNIAVALAALREDLATRAAPKPIFCFDELELLRVSSNASAARDGIAPVEQENRSALFTFLAELAAAATVLLIGQQSDIVTPAVVTLTGLPTPAIEQIFAQAGRPIPSAAAEQLYRLTGGNPRLLSLCLTLHQRGEAVEELIHAVGHEPALGPLFERIRRRLSREEEALLEQLAVFRSPAPHASWADATETLDQLLAKRLLLADGQGGIEVVPALRPHIYNVLAWEKRQRYHSTAAEIRLLYAEYTAAAHHLLASGQAATAIQLWFVQREHEIRRGQAGAAFALFHALSPNGIACEEADALAIIQADLHKRRGEFTQGLAVLNAVANTERNPHEARPALVQIEGLRGEFLELLGEPQQALHRYEQALQTTTQLLSRRITLHRRRSMLFVRQRDLAAAWQEVERAECQLQIVRGILADEEGRYGEAQQNFERALAQATNLDDQATMALAERHLANTHGRRQELSEAERYAQQAIQRYEALGDSFNVARVYDNLAFSYLHAKAVEQGIESARKAHRFFLAARAVYYSAIVATNLAEAYCDLGDLEQAATYAHQVLDSEERQPLPYALFTLGRLHQQRAQWAHARHSFAESVRVAEENDDKFMAAYARRALGVVLRELGQGETGEAELAQALVLFRALEIPGEIEETARLIGASEELL